MNGGPDPWSGSPRERLMVAAWEAGRMAAALHTGDPDAAPVPVGRPLACGVLLTALVVAGVLLAR